MSETSREQSSSRTLHHVRSQCRACGEAKLTRVLALGPQPLANANLRDLSEAEQELRFPLDVYFCESCTGHAFASASG